MKKTDHRTNSESPEGDVSADSKQRAASAGALPLEPGDYYMDGPFMVFTARYLLRRGYCCDNGCRHCPYQDKA